MEKKYPNIFKIPAKEQHNIDYTLIGIFDSSGSMSSYWSKLAEQWNLHTKEVKNKFCIAFSSQHYLIENTELSPKIQSYGAGSTNIMAGYNELNNQLKQKEMLKNVTIVFISDGQDDNVSTLQTRLKQIQDNIPKNKNINFLTVGVGKGFPTFLSMQLRELYHNGEHSIPPVFLIEEPSPSQSKIWEETFQQLSIYFNHSQKQKMKSPVQLYPWSEQVKEVYEGDYVLSLDEELVIEQDNMVIKKISQFTVQDCIEIFKLWVSKLQLESLKQDAKSKATVALELAQYYKDLIMQAQKQEKKKLSFHDRIVLRSKHDYDADLNMLIKEIRNLSEENILNKLSEQEAAKRLAIGTVVGKYHSQAMKIKGISVQDYVVARDNFVNLFETHKLNPESSQMPSIITLQNQKDVFMETDFVTGLKLCTNQYDLVETLPLIGQAIKIKRIDGSMINPYLVTVVDMPRHHQVIDTLALLGNSWELKLSKGNNEFEIVNAVLPLFDEKDADLKPFITSKLYSILMTFNVMQNADTCFENAYIALLSNTLMYLMNEPESEWRNNLIDKVFATIKITYSKSKGFQKYCEQLMLNPRIAVVTEHPDLENKCEDLSKALLMFFYLVKDGKVTEEKQKIDILNAVFADIYGRFYPAEQKLTQFFQLNNKEILKQVDFTPYTEKVKSKFTNLLKYYTLYDLKSDISKEVMSLDLKLNVDFEVELNQEKLWFVKDSKYGQQAQKNIYNYFLPGKQIDPKLQWIWIYHASLYRNSYERNKTDMIVDYQTVYNKIKQEKQVEILENNPIFDLVWQQISDSYKKMMIDIHQQQFILPMNQDILAQICQKKGLNQKDYKFNTVSNLLKNACMSTQCPYYMVVNAQLAQHLEGHIGKVPAFHKTIKLFPKEDPEIVYEKIIKGEELVWDHPHFSPTNMFSEYSKKALVEQKQQFIETIKKLQLQYQQIQSKQQ